MHTFKDKLGQDWNFELHLLNAQRIEGIDFSEVHPKGEKSIRIVTMTENQDTISLFMHTPILAAIVYFCCPEDRARLDVKTQDQFCALLDGDSIKRMREAVWGELGSFFTHLRTTFQTLINRFSAVEQQVDKLATQEAEKLLEPNRIAQELQKMNTEWNGSSST